MLAVSQEGHSLNMLEIAGINMAKFFDNLFTIGIVAGILIFWVMDVTWTGKYTVFHCVINK